MVGDASADDLGTEAWAPRPLALRFRREPSYRREAASTKIQARWRGGRARQRTVVAELGVEDLGLSLASWPPEAVRLAQVRPHSWAQAAGVTTRDELLAVQGHAVQRLTKDRFRGLLQTRPLELRLRRTAAPPAAPKSTAAPPRSPPELVPRAPVAPQEVREELLEKEQEIRRLRQEVERSEMNFQPLDIAFLELRK